MNWFIFSIFSAFAWGGAIILEKLGVIRISPPRFLMFQGIIYLVFYFIVWRFLGTKFPRGNYLFPILSEGCAALAFIFFFSALKEAPASLIVPINSFYMVIGILIGKFLFHNIISFRQSTGIFLSVIGILLLTIKDISFKKGSWIWAALITMILWGVWAGFSDMSVRIVRPINLNLFFSFMGILIWTPYYFLYRKKEANGDKRGYLFGAGSSLLSGTGSIFFYFAIFHSNVSLVIPVANIYPLFSVIFGVTIGERPSLFQWIGFPFVISGLFLIGG